MFSASFIFRLACASGCIHGSNGTSVTAASDMRHGKDASWLARFTLLSTTMSLSGATSPLLRFG